MGAVLLFAVGWVVGLVIASFTLVSVGIIVFFGIPTTRKLTASGVLRKNNPVQKRYYISIFILTVVYAVSLFAIYLWSSNVFAGFLVATTMSLLFSLGKLGKNSNNMQDYMDTNKQYITETTSTDSAE